MAGAGVPSLTMKDFTRQPKVVQFTINGDVFRGKPHLPAQTMIDFTVKVESLDTENTSPQEGFDSMLGSLQMVLMPDSYKLFRDRMKDPAQDSDGNDLPDATHPEYTPIELDQIPEVLEYLMGEYGMRPTQSSADSSDGQSSPASGTNSTESTSDVELISATSPSTDS